MTKTNRARLMLTVSMAIFGTIGLFVRAIDVSSGELALYRAVLAAVLITSYLKATGQKIPFAAIRKELPLLLLSGVAMGFNWILLFEAYNYTTVATATLCYYLAPVFITLASPLVLRERLTGKKILCVAVALLGMVPVSGILTAGFHVSELRGVAFGVGAALLYAAVILLNKKLTDISAMDRTTVQLLAAGAVLVPYVLLTTDFSALTLPPLGWGMLITVAVIHTGLAYVLYFGSLPHLSAQSAAMFSYLDPVLAVILSAAVLRDPITGFTILGAVLILGAAFVGELEFKRKKARL